MNKFIFRAKRIDNGKWVIGTLFHQYILPLNNIFDTVKNNTNDSLSITAYDIYEIDTNNICRCTELKDINDVLLFEGDKVDFLMGFPQAIEHIALSGTIVWDSGAFFVKYDKGKRQPIYNCSSIKKIGAIF